MDLTIYLSSLLNNHKEVGVDGLGTFSKQKVPGRYDAAQHMFLPPSAVLSFSPELTERKLLVELVARERQLAQPYAQRAVQGFAKQVQERLATAGNYPLPGLGILRKVDDELLFEPDAAATSAEFFGLPAMPEKGAVPEFSAPAEPEAPAPGPGANQPEAGNAAVVPADDSGIDSNPEATDLSERAGSTAPAPAEENEQPVLNPAEVPAADVPAEEPALSPSASETKPKGWVFDKLDTSEPLDAVKDHSAQEEPEKNTSWSLQIILTLVVLLAAAALAYYLKPEWFGDKPAKEAAPVVVQSTPVIPDTLAADSTVTRPDSVPAGLPVQPAPEKQVNEKPAAAAAPTKKADTTRTAIVPATVTYEIIAAAWRTEKKAAAFIKQMQQRGINARTVDIGGPMIKVSIGSFKTYEEAAKNLPELRKKAGSAGAYIHTRKPK